MPSPQQQQVQQVANKQQPPSPSPSSKKNVQVQKKPAYIVTLDRLHFYEKFEAHEGKFTCSHRAKFANGPNVYTVFAKILTNVGDKELMKNFREGARTLSTLRHPNLINFIALADDGSGPPVAVLEHIPGKTLLDHLKNNSTLITWPVQLRVAVECAQALDYLARNKVVYRFMSARNVILSERDFTSKLTDNELFRPKKGDKLPAFWMAPEVLKRYHFTTKSDIWAYGIFLTELFLRGEEPYPDMTSTDVINKLTDGSLFRMEISLFIPEVLRVEIARCWEETPDKRPDIHVIEKKIAKLIVPEGQ